MYTIQLMYKRADARMTAATTATATAVGESVGGVVYKLLK